MSVVIPLDLFYGQMHKFLPVGYRFHPTDDELVNHYLRGHIVGYNADTCIIPVIDNLYNIDPQHLPSLFRAFSIVRSKEAEWWFLTRLSFKTQSHRKFDRQTWSGHWKTTGKEKKINAKGTKESIGTMRNLVFKENEGSSSNETVWVMHEYCLDDSNSGANDQNFVLCHLVNRRDQFIEDSISAETGSMSPFRSLDNDKARNDIPEVSTNIICGLLQAQILANQNVVEAMTDPCAEALPPPVNPNLPYNPHLVNMGAPSDIDITSDSLSDSLKDLVDMIDEDGSIDEWLDAVIRQSSLTESDTDNGQGWQSPVNRPTERGEHVDRLRQTTIRPPGNMPGEEAGVHAQDNSNFPHIFSFQQVGYINCLTSDPVPTRASRDRDRVQLQNKPSGKPASEGKVTPSKEPALPHHKPVLKWVKTEAEPAQLSCASVPVFPRKYRFPPSNHRVEFPPVAEFTDRHGEYCHMPKVPNPTVVDEAGRTKMFSSAEAVLNWQTENALAQNKILKSIDSKISTPSEFPPVAEFTDRHGEYRHMPKVPNPTVVDEAGRTKMFSSAEAVLNWQTKNALAQNKILKSIDSKISNFQTKLDHVERKVDKTARTMQELLCCLEKLLNYI